MIISCFYFTNEFNMHNHSCIYAPIYAIHKNFIEIGLFMQMRKMGFGQAASSSRNTNVMDLGKKISVLIVDDNLLIQKIHKLIMTRFGAEVHIAGNGKEAVDLYVSGKSFDLIVMDLEMPVMDGFEVSC